MKGADIATSLGAHAVAASVYAVVSLAVPAVLVVILFVVMFIASIVTGDMGGPMFYPIVFMMALFYGVLAMILGFALFSITGAIQLLRRRVRISFWVPLALVLISLLATVAVASPHPNL